ncbi:MAG TPA: transglutaminase domain-containing protein [Bacteroidota bacterium]|nr:transglutaminase domain-containing protein [Bacteroidota bacterium]
MNFRRFLFFAGTILVYSILPSQVFSQDAPMKWGEIPKADLEMKSFPQDTNASAVILCDYGNVTFDDELTVVYQHQMRVKILSVKGYDEWGRVSLNLRTEDHAQTIDDIAGVTYALDQQGNIVKHELQESDIFTEHDDANHTRYKFTLPSLSPGCVVEIRYTIKNQSWWNVPDWQFQFSEPVRWSEFRFCYPTSISYAVLSHGYERFMVNTTEKVVQFFHGSASGYFGMDNVDCYQKRWAMQNVPALRDEPYITTMNDYYNRIEIQLAGYALKTGGTKKVISDWMLFNDDLLKDEHFGDCIDVTRRVRKQAEELTTGLSTCEEKMTAIYNWVSQSIVWNHRNRIFAEQDVNDVLESKKGSNADITFLLLSLLKSAGIEGDPVILSTRDNGSVQDWYPILSQFNYVLAKVAINGQDYFLDATNPSRPMELIPTKIINVKGFVVKKNGGVWVKITSQKQYNNVSLAVLTLHEDGTLDGTMEDSYREYASLFMRQDLKDKKEMDIAKETFNTEQQGITIDSVHIANKDSINAPLTLKVWINAQTYAQSAGDMIYINPQILHRMQENSFKDRTRLFPIDYGYLRSNKIVVMLTIPNGFELKEKLADRMLYVGSDLLSYSRKVAVVGNRIQITVKREVHQIEIPEKYYADLKNFYASIVAAEAEQLVLTRIKPEVPPPAAAPSVETKPVKTKGKK